MTDILKIFLKKHIAQLIILLVSFLLISLVVFQTTYDTVRTVKGYQSISNLLNKTAYVGNNESDDRLRQKIGDMRSPSDKAKMAAVIQKINDSFNPVSQIQYSSAKYPDIEQIEISEDWLKIFNLSVIKGQTLSHDSFKNQGDVPIVAGYSFAKQHPIGSSFQDIDVFTGKERTYVVKGILPADASVPSLYDIGDYQTLSRSYLAPLQVDDFEENVAFDNLDLYLQNLIIFTNDSDKIQQLEQYISDLGLYHIKFYTQRENTHQYFELLKQKMIIQIVVLLVVLIVNVTLINRMLSLLTKEERHNLGILFILGLPRVKIVDYLKRTFLVIIGMNIALLLIWQVYMIHAIADYDNPIASVADVVTNSRLQAIVIVILIMMGLYSIIGALINRRFKKFDVDLNGWKK